MSAAQAVNSNGNGVYPAGMTQTHPSLSEADCSVNGFFSVEGFARDFQATGRGRTAQEAAANLKQTIDATRAAFAPPAPVVIPSRAERVGQMLAKGIACAVRNADMGLCSRLSKAAFLVLSNAVEPTNCPGTAAVRSQDNPDTWYTISGQACSCPDWGNAAKAGKTRPCKHILAVELDKRLQS